MNLSTENVVQITKAKIAPFLAVSYFNKPLADNCTHNCI